MENRFSWSPSRERLFHTCKRAYFYHYYGSWGGWSHDAPERVRLAYRLKQISTIQMWAGAVVHQIIQEALETVRDATLGLAPPGSVELLTAERLRARAREEMIRGWRQSKGKAWQVRPKGNLNLFEHYYGLPKAEVDAASVEARDRVWACLDWFREGPMWERVLAIPRDGWISVEELESFEVDGTLVWVQLDLAFREGRGAVVVDWKTGSPKEEDRLQAEVYGLFARESWGDVGAVAAELQYLFTREVQTMEVRPGLLEQTREYIAASVGEMRALLVDPERNVAREEDFPTTHDPGACTTCKFRELCGM